MTAACLIRAEKTDCFITQIYLVTNINKNWQCGGRQDGERSVLTAQDSGLDSWLVRGPTHCDGSTEEIAREWV